MSIAEFIRESVLRPRLKQAGCAGGVRRRQALPRAVFRSGGRQGAGGGCDLKAASKAARRRCWHCERWGTQGAAGRCVDLCAAKRPETDEQKQADPFALYAECGAVFPQDDGDEYLSLCLRARPDHATEIRQVFAGSPAGPAFAVIDAIGGGVSWPQLRATLAGRVGPRDSGRAAGSRVPPNRSAEGAGGLGAGGARLPPCDLGLEREDARQDLVALADELVALRAVQRVRV
jgi:hypothetical protein